MTLDPFNGFIYWMEEGKRIRRSQWCQEGKKADTILERQALVRKNSVKESAM